MDLDASITINWFKSPEASILQLSIDLYVWDINMKSGCLGRQINKENKTH